jgi:hypothetical protein
MRSIKIVFSLCVGLLLAGLLLHSGILTADGGKPLPDPWSLVADGGKPLPDPWIIADGGKPLPDPWLIADGGKPLPDPWVGVTS